MEVPLSTLASIIFNPITAQFFIGLFVLFILLIISAFISGSEVAFFSLSPQQKDHIRQTKSKQSDIIISLLHKSEKLLATILIVNNLVNVGIVILSSFLTNSLLNFSANPQLGFIFQIVFITFILLLFGEIIPKVYASKNPVAFAMATAAPLQFLSVIFSPISKLLTHGSSFIKKRLNSKKTQVSINELSDALDLTENNVTVDDKILKGIVKFADIGVSEIMRSRMDIITINIKDPFTKVIEIVRSSGYSRIPVIDETFDKIKGILYVKDLIPYINKSQTFRWPSLIRPAFYIPETKKIDLLLKDFQTKKIHLAIILDEYGGTSGIVTLEDVIEEIIGEINDEFDSIEQLYTKISDTKYQFEAKTLLIDFCKKFNLEDDYFDKDKADAESIAGFILELKGEIPEKKETISYREFTFEIKSVDNRRIKQVYVYLNQEGLRHEG